MFPLVSALPRAMPYLLTRLTPAPFHSSPSSSFPATPFPAHYSMPCPLTQPYYAPCTQQGQGNSLAINNTLFHLPGCSSQGQPCCGSSCSGAEPRSGAELSRGGGGGGAGRSCPHGGAEPGGGGGAARSCPLGGVELGGGSAARSCPSPPGCCNLAPSNIFPAAGRAMGGTGAGEPSTAPPSCPGLGSDPSSPWSLLPSLPPPVPARTKPSRPWKRSWSARCAARCSGSPSSCPARTMSACPAPAPSPCRPRTPSSTCPPCCSPEDLCQGQQLLGLGRGQGQQWALSLPLTMSAQRVAVGTTRTS